MRAVFIDAFRRCPARRHLRKSQLAGSSNNMFRICRVHNNAINQLQHADKTPFGKDDSLDALSRALALQSNIWCHPAKYLQKGGREMEYMLSSPGERGYSVIKLDIYNFSEIDKSQWWTIVPFRSTFLTFSPVDPTEFVIFFYIFTLLLTVSVFK